MNGISVLIEETPESIVAPPPCEDTARRRLSMNKETDPRQTPNLLATWTCTSQGIEL